MWISACILYTYEREHVQQNIGLQVTELDGSTVRKQLMWRHGDTVMLVFVFCRLPVYVYNSSLTCQVISCIINLGTNHKQNFNQLPITVGDRENERERGGEREIVKEKKDSEDNRKRSSGRERERGREEKSAKEKQARTEEKSKEREREKGRNTHIFLKLLCKTIAWEIVHFHLHCVREFSCLASTPILYLLQSTHLNYFIGVTKYRYI